MGQHTPFHLSMLVLQMVADLRQVRASSLPWGFSPFPADCVHPTEQNAQVFVGEPDAAYHLVSGDLGWGLVSGGFFVESLFKVLESSSPSAIEDGTSSVPVCLPLVPV